MIGKPSNVPDVIHLRFQTQADEAFVNVLLATQLGTDGRSVFRRDLYQLPDRLDQTIPKRNDPLRNTLLYA
jgi:hypothetical protein